MDNLRVFNTFKSKSVSEFKAPSKRILTQQGQTSRPSMRERSLDDKPSLSRSDILQILEKKDQGESYSAKVSGKRFGDGFLKSKEELPANEEELVVMKDKLKVGNEDLKEGQAAIEGKTGKADKEKLQASKKSEKVVGDVQKNDPNDPMTTEKLKGILNSGAINFSDKEKRVLGSILGS